ncbi:S8 family peptidase [Pseudomonadota bacterium]
MRYALLPLLLAACLLPCGPLEATEQPELLKVFLQGGPAPELKALVEANGGTVSHELHIIDAVGAELSPRQLERVIESPLVSRYYDDLSTSPPVDNDPQDKISDCDVAGSLELEFHPTGISWTLYNKQDAPVPLRRLELGWPQEIGTVTAIALGNELIGPEDQKMGATNPLVLEFRDSPTAPGPSLVGIEKLVISFKAPATGAPPRSAKQRDFELKADFATDCSTELMPAYDNNHENFYYNRVAGVEALQLHGVTGKGVTVAVIDSGLWEHPALARDTAGKQRIIARYDAINDSLPEEVFDASGHGTHMSSVIAHSGPVTLDGEATGSYKGVAPDVKLVSVKAFDVAGQGDFLDIVRAVQWVVDNKDKYNIRVLNLSFSARPRWHYWQDPINQAIMRAWAAGITVVAAAGNEGPDPMTIGSPGNLPYIITVGAVTDSWTPETRDDDYIPDFSSRGPTPNAHIKPDIVAPGGHITGVTRPGSGLTEEHPEYLLSTGEFVMTGSSQASALVAGIAALLLQLEPELSPDDIKCKLMSSAEPALNRDGLLAYSPFQQGNGYVNATRAVTLGEKGCGNPELDIQREIRGEGHFTGPAIVDEDGEASLPGLNTMLSPEPAAKGHSDNRKWGVKAHIEREDNLPTPPPGSTVETASPFNWMELYLQEKAAIENLSQERRE